MASKSSDVRPKITLACTECKERNYITKKNRRNDPDRLELTKFCPRCRKHTAAPRDPLTSASPTPHDTRQVDLPGVVICARTARPLRLDGRAVRVPHDG